MHQVLTIGCKLPTGDLLWQSLSDAAEILEAHTPAEGLYLALQHTPECILLDAAMPHRAAFHLCRTFARLEPTRAIPVFVIGGEIGVRYKDLWRDLGARIYFEEPVDLAVLRERVCEVLRREQPERRAEARYPANLVLQISGTDIAAEPFERLVLTDDASEGGFLCDCPVSLPKDATVSVLFLGETAAYLGGARVARLDWPDGVRQRYAFHFLERPRGWLPRIWPDHRFVPSWARARPS